MLKFSYYKNKINSSITTSITHYTSITNNNFNNFGLNRNIYYNLHKNFVIKLKKRPDNCTSYPKLIPVYNDLLTKNINLIYKTLFKSTDSSANNNGYVKSYKLLESSSTKDIINSYKTKEEEINNINDLDLETEFLRQLTSKPSLEYLIKLKTINNKFYKDRNILTLLRKQISYNINLIKSNIGKMSFLSVMESSLKEKINYIQSTKYKNYNKLEDKKLFDKDLDKDYEFIKEYDRYSSFKKLRKEYADIFNNSKTKSDELKEVYNYFISSIIRLSKSENFIHSRDNRVLFTLADYIKNKYNYNKNDFITTRSHNSTICNYSIKELSEKGLIIPEIPKEIEDQLYDIGNLKNIDYLKSVFTIESNEDESHTIISSKLFPHKIRLISVTENSIDSILVAKDVLSKYNPKSIIFYERNPNEFNTKSELLNIINKLKTQKTANLKKEIIIKKLSMYIVNEFETKNKDKKLDKSKVYNYIMNNLSSLLGNYDASTTDEVLKETLFDDSEILTTNNSKIKQYLDNLDKDKYFINIKERIVEKVSQDNHGQVSEEEKNKIKRTDFYNTIILELYLKTSNTQSSHSKKNTKNLDKVSGIKLSDHDIIFGKSKQVSLISDMLSQDDPKKFFNYLKNYSLIDKTNYLMYYKKCPYCNESFRESFESESMLNKTKYNKKQLRLKKQKDDYNKNYLMKSLRAQKEEELMEENQRLTNDALDDYKRLKKIEENEKIKKKYGFNLYKDIDKDLDDIKHNEEIFDNIIENSDSNNKSKDSNRYYKKSKNNNYYRNEEESLYDYSDTTLNLDESVYHIFNNPQELLDKSNIKSDIESFVSNIIKCIRTHPHEKNIVCFIPDEVNYLICEEFLEHFKYVNTNIRVFKPFSDIVKEFVYSKKIEQIQKKNDIFENNNISNVNTTTNKNIIDRDYKTFEDVKNIETNSLNNNNNKDVEVYNEENMYNDFKQFSSVINKPLLESNKIELERIKAIDNSKLNNMYALLDKSKYTIESFTGDKSQQGKPFIAKTKKELKAAFEKQNKKIDLYDDLFATDILNSSNNGVNEYDIQNDIDIININNIDNTMIDIEQSLEYDPNLEKNVLKVKSIIQEKAMILLEKAVESFKRTNMLTNNNINNLNTSESILNLIKSNNLEDLKNNNSIDVICNKLGLCCLFFPDFLKSSEFKLINKNFDNLPTKYYNAYFKRFNFTNDIEMIKIKNDYNCMPKKVLYDQYINIEDKQRKIELDKIKALERTLLT